MNPFEIFIAIIVGVPLVLYFFYKIVEYMEKRDLYKKLLELKDCPFEYFLKDSYLIFNLGHATLYCNYRFGIQRSGVYGIKEIILKGINEAYGGSIELKFGQSVFPVISEVKEFNKWSNTKLFPIIWDSDFKYTWDRMIGNLNNLDYLEQKYDKEN